MANLNQAPGHHQKWLRNAERQGVAEDVVDEIARRHHVTLESFRVLDGMEEIKDPDGKSFFLLPPGAGGDDARAAALLTYVLNAGTGYGKSGPTDFPPTPYGPAEVARIIKRQHANRWSYSRDVRFVHRNGARLVTTPNGMLMGTGGNVIQRQFSRRGGTTWGDIFMVNTGRVSDPAERLRRLVSSGHAWHNLGLDRVLHHEERHCRQWAARGYAGMIGAYAWELLRELVFRKINRLEADAGLSDGGYRA
ncbi:hypothetical protein [Mycobacterium parmense]|uniref:Uncharacterized protein n=1 Tax=Mycobacterium parmense TaxID=185642 RepID=A0A7I7YZ03_9MYCO|nr:hypothetical protein [Mycobacterium parmense]MCV7350405.1 hypothetical protein [Mycobacterium parmense]ORW52053.1 hypothetical protein AWC20_02865 [Mycobacterium parmense]BBZ46173.1 hypothetical protein MPRM_34540 [Mycobacterium parmense]